MRPLFRVLLRTPFGRGPALELFDTHGRASYHPICSKMVALDIAKETAKAPVDAAAMVQVDGVAAAAGAAAGATAQVRIA